jgi:predicted DNA-binding transcriptional regulator YafY
MISFDHDGRLSIMLTLLTWEGRLSNSRLRNLFGLSSIRASEWLRDFRDQNPLWLSWEPKTKCHIATSAFFRQALRSQADSLARYVVLVGLPVAQQDAENQHLLWAAYPDLYTPKPRFFSSLLLAIQLGKQVEIEYRSLTTPHPHRRTISPHSLVRAGRRWHARAFCHLKGDFRDFNLGRISAIKLRDSAEAIPTSTEDLAWNTFVQVRIGAHPLLTAAQVEVIRFEHFNETASMAQSCRAALVSYFIQDVKAAINTSKQRPPDFQLAVENIDEVSAWLFSS